MPGADPKEGRPAAPWRTVVAGAVGLALLLALSGHGHVIHSEWMMPLLWLAGPLALVEWMRRRLPGDSPAEPDRATAAGFVLLGFALLFVVSSAAKFKWFYFDGWLAARSAPSPFGPPGPAWLVLLTALVWPLAWRPGRHTPWLLATALAFIVGAAAFWFGRTSLGLPLYNDDHPSFIGRLWLYGQTFPRLVSYSPLWNGGILDSVGLSTGAAIPALLLWPLWKWAPAMAAYNQAVLLLTLAFIPASAVLAIRMMGGRWTAAWAAALLSIGVSRYHLLWLFHYGTLGANCSSALVMLVGAALYRIAVLDRREPLTIATLGFSVFLMLLWPLGLFMMAPFALAVALHARRLRARSLAALAIGGALAAALFAYPLAVLLRHAHVASQTWVAPVAAGAGRDWVALLVHGAHQLHDHFRHAHPLLIFLGVGGAICAATPEMRRWSAAVLAGFVALTAWGAAIIPRLPLERMAVPLFFAAVPPAAFVTALLLETRGRGTAILRAALLAILLLGGWSVVRIYADMPDEGYDVLQPNVQALAQWARKETAPGERIMIAGSTGHDYGGGHVAFLPVMLGREMVSSEYRHEQDPDIRAGSPPHRPPGSAAEFRRVADLLGVSHVVTMDEDWIRFLNADSGHWTYAGTIGGKDIHAFHARVRPSLFTANCGTISSAPNRITVTLDDPARPAVILYRWADGLAADPPATISPFARPGWPTSIRIEPNGSRVVTIRYRPWL